MFGHLGARLKFVLAEAKTQQQARNAAAEKVAASELSKRSRDVRKARNQPSGTDGEAVDGACDAADGGGGDD